ncbi:MAG: response regulator [Desulfobacterales bacterium]|nr:response regulator [Desulfobacterales bacterium]
MKNKSKMHRKIADNKLMFIGIGLGILFWFLEAAIHAFIFYHGRLIDEILAPDPHETWMRSLVVCLFILFGIYAQSIVNSRKRVEEKLRNSEARLELILATMPSGLFAVDSNRKIVYWNKEAEEITGLKAGEVIGKDCLEALDCDECKKECGLFDDNVNKPIYGQECVLHVHGRDITISKNADILKDSRGHTIAGLECFVDITKRKEVEEEKKKLEAHLQRAHKMKAIAILAGGIAHEFNNALVGVSGNIELLQMGLPDDENIDRYVERMKNPTRRMADLTNRLLAYARGGKYQPRTISLNDFVQDTVPLIQHSIDPAIRVETELPGDISNVEVDLTQMQMVLSAVLSNASEAMEGKGRIRIITRNEEIDEEFAKTNPDLKLGPYVCLTIEDEGKGMDEVTRNRVFEPFFTTKFQGRGLGMAAAYGIIKNHGGWISIDSELGKGTVVRIYLPAAEAEVERAKETKIEVTTGTGTILVIEDEDVVIDVIRSMLERLGYRVLLAKTGKEAVDISRTFDGDIDLAILDIVLPDIGGKEVYRLITEARSGLKVIVCSGYTVDGPAQEILDAGAQDFIQKPFSFNTLSEKLKEVIRGS